MRESRFSSTHTHSWTAHREPTTTNSKPPHSSHIASSHWVTGTLSKARGKRVVKNVPLRELLSQSGNQLTTARQRASTQMYFWAAPIGWVHSKKNRVLWTFYTGWMIYRIIKIWTITWTSKRFLHCYFCTCINDQILLLSPSPNPIILKSQLWVKPSVSWE